MAHLIRLAAAVAFATAAACAWSEEFPARALTVVVPFPPGGGTDLFARALAQPLSSALGKPVVVDNRSGATGNIGAESVARALADGHTLLYTSASIALSGLVASGNRFDPRRDLAPISMTVSIPYVLAVHPSVAAPRMQDLVALARAQPGHLNYSSGGPGSALHLPMELLKAQANIDVHHVPYRGAAPAQAALLSGEVQMALLVPQLVQGQIRNGRLRALAVTSATRTALLPDVPTLQEAGIRGYEALQWHGFFAPAKTPRAIVERLQREIAKAFSTPEMKLRAAAEGAQIVASTPAQFAAFFAAEQEKWGEVVKRSGVQLD